MVNKRMLKRMLKRIISLSLQYLFILHKFRQLSIYLYIYLSICLSALTYPLLLPQILSHIFGITFFRYRTCKLQNIFTGAAPRRKPGGGEDCTKTVP